MHWYLLQDNLQNHDMEIKLKLQLNELSLKLL